jgi:hypothetical protein
MAETPPPADNNAPKDEPERAASTSDNTRRRPTLSPMPSSNTTAPMRTRPPMTPLPPLAPKPPPPPEVVVETVKKPKRRVGLWILIFAVLAVGAAGAYYQFFR